MKKRYLIVLPCIIMAALSVIGFGFASWFFESDKTERPQDVTVSVSGLDVSSLTLNNQSSEYRIFMDKDSVYLIGSMNPSVEASFDIGWDAISDIPDGQKIKLVCDIVIKDGDSRGITVERLKDDTSLYAWSKSILDYFEPKEIDISGDGSKPFTLVEGSENYAMYRAVISEDVPISATSERKMLLSAIDFIYKSYSDGNNSGYMTPASQYLSLKGYAQVMNACREAGYNSTVTITFRMLSE